ncbi:uncharacterized protein rab44 isoform X1 [Channa argus]|uniref:uncharacterized protein rab44 isoform X1 n=2 Tax=Channa argus TaxID=215402 RepID=UPI0035221B7A
MSASNTRKDEKKKRLGSRRSVAKQNNALEVEFDTDRTSASLPHVPQENTESLSLFANPEKSMSEGQHPRSPEQFENKRKLGSSRKSRGRQRVQGSATESYYQIGEEVEEKNRGNEALATMHMSLTKQSERLAELAKRESEENATHNSSLYSAMPSEVESPDLIASSEDVLESLSTSGNECKVMSDSCKSDKMLKVTHKSYTLQSVDFSDISSQSVVSCPTVEQEHIDKLNSREMPDKLLNMYSAIEEVNSVGDEDTDLLWQDGNLHSNWLMSESHVESLKWFSANAERTQNAELECNISLPLDDKSADKVQNEHVSTLLTSQPQETDGSIDAQTDIDFGNRNTRGNKVFETTKMSSLIQTVVQVKSVETDNRNSQVKAAEDLVGNSELNSSFVHQSPSVNTQLIGPQVVEDKIDEFPSTHAVKKLEQKNCDDPEMLTQQVNLQANRLVSESPVTSQNMDSSMSAEIKTERKSSGGRHAHSHCSVEQTKWFLHKNEELTNQEPTDHVKILAVKQAQHSTDNVAKVHEQPVISTQLQDLHDVDPFENTTCDNVENSVTLQTMRPEELRQDTEQDIIISETDDVSLYSASIPGYSSEVMKLINYPEADQESLIHQTENLQAAWDRETDFKVDTFNESVAVTLEVNVKSQTLQSEVDLSTDDEQNEHFHLPEVRAAHDSVDAVNKELEQEIEPTQMQELQEIDYSHEDKTHDLTQSSDNCSGSQKDQSELVDTSHSELIVESTDNFITVQEDSNPGDSQGENPTQESDVVILHQTNADHYPYDAMKPQIDDLERAVTAVDPDINNECQVEDDINHYADQSSHQKKDGLFSEHKESKSYQVLESESHTHLGSQPQDSSVNIDKENNTDLNLIGNRRKLGSSRKKKGRHHVKEFSAGHTEEIEENISVSEVLETTTETSALQTMRPEELRQDTEQDIIISETDDVSLYSASIPGYSSEVLKLIKYPEADQESLIHQSENLQEACEEQNEHFHLPEVRAAHDSVDAVNKELEQEIEPTQMQELQEIDYSSEDKTHDLTQSSDNCSGSQKDQSELVVEIDDNFITVQDDSHPGDSQLENPIQEGDVVILHQTNADHYSYDAMKPQIDDLERAVTAVDQEINNECQVEDDIDHCADQSSHQKKDGLFSEDEESKSYQVLESEIHTHLGSQPQDSSVNIDKENNTDLTHIGNRRKLGSTCKKKGQRHVKEFSAGHTEETEENIPVSEVLETTTETSALQTMRPEELRQDTEQDIIISKTDDVSLYSASIPGYSSEVLKLIKYPDADRESLIHQTENLQEACEEQNEHFHLPEVRAAHDSVDAVNKELEQAIEPTQMQELQEIDYCHEDKSHDLTQSSDNCSGSQKDQSELVELIVESTDNFITVQEDSHPGDSQGENSTQESDVVILHQTNADHYSYDAMKPQIDDLERAVTAVDPDINNECQVEDDINHCADQSSHQKKDGLFSEDEESKSYQVLESEIHTHLGSQPQDSSVNIDKENNTDLTHIGNRRKLGSSRKKKGRHHVKESSAGHTEEIEENIPVSEVLETTTETSALQTMRPEELRQDTEQDITISETDDVSLYSASIPGYSSEVLKLIKYPDADRESLIHQSENLQEACEEQNEHFHLPEVRAAHDSVDAVNKELEQEIEPTQMQELQEIDYCHEDKTHDLTQSSDNCSGSQKDQSELVVEIDDNFMTVQDDSHPGDSQLENPIQEGDVVILHQTNADHYSYDAMKPQIDDLERAVTAVDQEINNECQVEDDIDHCADQSSHQKKDGLFSEDEERKSYQVLESEIHTHLGSQPQDSSVNIDKENNTDLTHIGNRRKLGSSRKKKGRHHVKESSAGHTEEIEENIPVSEVLETTTETSALQTMRPEELRQDTEQDITISETDDVSLYSASIPGYSSEVLKLIKYPDADRESLIHQTENLQAAWDRETDFKVQTFNESVEVTLEVNVKSQTFQSEVDLSTDDEQNEHFHLPEVRAAHDSVDAVNKELEQEIEPTQMQELQEIDNSSEDKTHDLTQSSDNCSGSQKDQSELVDTSHSELIVESTDNFITVQEDSNPGDSRGENPTQESHVVILHQTNADHYPYDAMKPQIDDLERAVTAVDPDINNECQVEDDINHYADQSSHQKKDGLFSEHKESKSYQVLESEIHTHLGSQPQDSSVNIDKENNTDLNLIGNRRKLGSSRKKKGRHHVKEFSAGHTEEIEENISVSEVLETTTETSALQTMRPEELRQDTEQDIIISETDDVSLYSASIPGYSSEVLKLIKYPEADQESLIHQSENLQEACEEQNEHFHLPEVRAAHDSVDAVNKELEQEIEPTQMQELQEIDYSSEDKTHDLTQSSDNCSGSQKDQSELVVEIDDNFFTVQDDSHPGDSQLENPIQEGDVVILHQTNADHYSYDAMKPQIDDLERAVTAVDQEINNECQVEDDIDHCAEKSSHQKKDGLFSEDEESKSFPVLESEIHTHLGSQPQDSSVNIDKENNTDLNLIGNRRKLGSSRKKKGRHHVKESSAGHTEEIEENIPVSEVLETTTETSALQTMRPEELRQDTEQDIIISETDDVSLYSASVPGYSSEVMKLINYPDADQESLIHQSENLQEACEEQNEHFHLPEVRAAHDSVDAVNKKLEQEIEPTQMQELQEIDYCHEDKTHDLTQSSDNCSGSQKDQSELVDTSHSELIVVSTDNFITIQEDSNPGDSKGENPTQESDVMILHQTNADHYPYDSIKPQIDDLERAVTAVDPDINNECQVEDDINHCADQSSHQKKDGLFSEDEESKSFPVLESEIHIHLGSQPQDSSVNIDKEKNTDLTHIGNRRKLGSSRKKKGQRHVKEFSAGHTEEIEENIPVSEVLETTTETSALQTMRPEELRQDTEQDITISETDDVSLYTASIPGYSSEVLKLIKYPDADRESLIHQTENLQEACEEQNEHFHLPEVRAAHDSVDVVNKELEQEIEPTQMQELQEIVYSSEDKTHDLTQSSYNCSGSQKDQSELVDTQSTQMQQISQIYYSGVTHDGTEHSNIISVNSKCEVNIKDTHQSQLSVKSITDYPAARQEVINSDKEEHPTESNNFKALDQLKVDYHAHATNKPQKSEIERVDNVLKTVYENERQEENEIKSCAEHKSHLEKDILSSKLESEYSLKALHSEMHALFDPRNPDNSVSIDEQHNTGFSCTGSKRRLGYSRRNKGPQNFKNSVAESYQKPTDQSDFTDLHDKKCPHVSSVTDTESKEREKDTELLMQWGILQASSLLNDLHLKSDHIGLSVTMEGTTGKNSPEEHTELKCIVEQPTVLSLYEVTTNEEQRDRFNLTEVRGVQNSKNTAKKVHEEDIKSTQLQEMHQISNITDKEDQPSVQTLPLDSQPQDYCKSIKAQTETVTGFKFTATKRKLGSSRRNKGNQHGLDSVTETHRKCEEEVVETTCCDESSETTKTSSSIETTRLEKLKQQTDPGVKPAEKITLVNEGETTKKVQEKNTTLLQNIIETTTMVSVDITRSDKDDLLKFSLEFSEGEKKNNRNELKNLTSLTDYGSVKMELTPDASSLKDDSALQRMSCDDIVSCRSVISNVLCQEEAFHVQNTESSSCDKVLLEQELDVGDSKKSAKFSPMDAQRSQQSVQEETHLDSNVNLEGKSTQRRRKMGSSRKLIRKPEEQVDDKDNSKQSNLDAELDRTKLGNMEVVEELPPIVTPQVSLNERHLSLSSVYEEQQEDSERNVGEEPSQLNDSAIHITSVVAGRNRRSVSPWLSPNTEDAINSYCIPVSLNEIAQNNELIQEGIKDIPDHALKSQEAPGVTVPDLKKVKSSVRGAAGETKVQASVQELYSTNQEACNTNFEMKATSPNFSSTNRRRKLGSTRKIPVSQSKREDFCEKQEVVNEVTVPIVGDDLTGNASGVKEPQRHQNVEESRAPLSQVLETEHQISSDYLSAEPCTSPKPNVMSESASGGRRRKMGSHRKSRGNPNCEDQVAEEDSITDPQKGRDVRGMTDESGIKTINEHSDEGLVLDTISEVGESDKKPSSNISSSRPGESPRPVSQKLPEPVTEVITATPLDSENQKKLSLVGESTGAAVGLKSFNVMMVGDTSVGKTSFMKRAHSGKFSFDLPASVGLDSCKWTVVVDGKPVILHLWDTAGQERFHSITRHIFHKAQAFLLMYDITSPKSFSAVSYWANCIQEGAPDNVTVLLLGNKSDRADRQVKTQDGEILAKEYNFKFMECSAATGENVIQCLENMARMLSQKADTTQEAMVLKKESQQKQRSGCC